MRPAGLMFHPRSSSAWIGAGVGDTTIVTTAGRLPAIMADPTVMDPEAIGLTSKLRKTVLHIAGPFFYSERKLKVVCASKYAARERREQTIGGDCVIP